MPIYSVVDLRVSHNGCSLGDLYFPESCQNTVLLPESINIEMAFYTLRLRCHIVVSPAFIIQKLIKLFYKYDFHYNYNLWEKIFQQVLLIF